MSKTTSHQWYTSYLNSKKKTKFDLKFKPAPTIQTENVELLNKSAHDDVNAVFQF